MKTTLLFAVVLVVIIALVAISANRSDSIVKTAKDPQHPVPVLASSVQRQPPLWGTTSETNTMDGDITKTIAATTSDETPGSFFIRCRGGQVIDAALSPDDWFQPQLGGGYTIRVKFDDGPAVNELWTESTDGKGAFARAKVALVRKMLSHSKMLLEFTPYEKRQRVLAFDLTGLPATVRRAVQDCGRLVK